MVVMAIDYCWSLADWCWYWFLRASGHICSNRHCICPPPPPTSALCLVHSRCSVNIYVISVVCVQRECLGSYSLSSHLLFLDFTSTISVHRSPRLYFQEPETFFFWYWEMELNFQEKIFDQHSPGWTILPLPTFTYMYIHVILCFLLSWLSKTLGIGKTPRSINGNST